MGNQIAGLAGGLSDPTLEDEDVLCTCDPKAIGTTSHEKDDGGAEWTFRVLAFNTPTKGDDFFRDAWNFRRRGVAKLIEQHGADVVMLQETHETQTADVLRELLKLQQQRQQASSPSQGDSSGPAWAFFGRGRNADGSDEYQPVFWDTRKWILRASGVFWLSENPDIPGSMSWDTACTRHTVWVLLTSLRPFTEGQSILFVNTHLDHVSSEARTKGALLCLQKMRELGVEHRVDATVFAGDLNAPPAAAPVVSLIKGGLRLPTVQPGPGTFVSGNRTTFVGFAGQRNLELDYIFHSGKITCQRYVIVRDTFESGRRLSDHNAILSEFSCVKKAPLVSSSPPQDQAEEARRLARELVPVFVAFLSQR